MTIRERVDELWEEGNAFEAGVVSGVEESRGREGKEVQPLCRWPGHVAADRPNDYLEMGQVMAHGGYVRPNWEKTGEAA